MPLEQRLKKIRSEILDTIRPTPEENLQIASIISEISHIVKEWNKSHNKYPYAFISAQGSTGIKQTHLRYDSDIDLFIFLDPKDYMELIHSASKNRDKISDLFRKYCNEWITPALQERNIKEIYVAYAEHPYISSKVRGYDVDIVFSFYLNEEYLQRKGPITAVDRTYYHSKFVQENLTPEQIDDVRILKMFFKNNFSYGDKAPIARGGFIGYAAELLIHHFGDIWSLFQNFNQLPYECIDFFGRDIPTLRKFHRFQKDFLIITDPTDKKRNVAASISERAWIYCSKKVNTILKSPMTGYILQKLEPSFKKADRELNNHYVIVETLQVSDSHYTKIRDKLYSLAESLKATASFEFNHSVRFPSVNYALYFNPSTKHFSLAFYTDRFHIAEEYLRRGPRTDREQNFEKFKAKHPDVIIKNGYGYVKEVRKFTDFLDFIEISFKERMFDEIKLLNISRLKNVINEESVMAVHVLKECIVPYQEELDQIMQKILPKNTS